MNEEVDEGTQFLLNHITNFKGKDVCASCGKKLGIFGWKEVPLRFGLTQRLCKDCYKEHKKAMKIARKY